MLLEPLRARPGATFTCHGDGLCCSDVHALGPLDEGEAATLAAIDPQVVVEHQGDLVVLTKADGTCIFQRGGRCALHAALGAAAKPDSCRQFPFSLIATPSGGRIATEHRCPCRTLGLRAPVEVKAAREACAGDPDRIIRSTLPLSEREEVDLPTWEAIEGKLLEQLASGREPLSVLGAEPFTGGEWTQLATKLASETGTSRFARALCCFAGAIGGAPERDALPWKDAFDAAEARSEPGDPDAILADWLADYVWSLEWAFIGTFAQARMELATRVANARRIAAQRVDGRTLRPDRAMAEAIAVVELVGIDDEYRAFVGALDG